MKKILMPVHSDYVHDSRVIREAQTLSGEGYSVKVIAASWKPENVLPFMHGNVEVIPVPLKRKSGKLRFAEMMWKTYRHLRRIDADIIHAHDLDTLAPSVRAARKKKIPVIYDSHELALETHSVHDRKWVKAVWGWIERRNIGSAAAIITVSDGIADELQKRYGLEDRPTVIRNFSNKPTTEPENNGIPLPSTTKFTGVYQGMLQKGRGLPELIKAISLAPDWGLMICGDGPLRPSLEQLIAGLNLSDRVFFTGMLSQEKLRGVVGKCDAGFLLTEPEGLSQYHSLPNKLTDYVHSRLPVFARDLPEIKKLVDGFGIGHCVNGVDGLAELLNHYPGKAHFADALAKASGELNWDNEKSALLGVYRRVMG